MSRSVLFTTWPLAATLTIVLSGCAHRSEVAGSAPAPAIVASARANAAGEARADATAAHHAGDAELEDAAEVEAGRETAAYLSRTIGLVDDPELQLYVQQVGTAVAAESSRPELPWYFAILDDPTPNAFALPGGTVLVTRGMLAHLDSEAELAALLGHEIAHVAAHHSMRVLGQLASPGLEPPATAPLPVHAPMDGGVDVLFREYGRQAERQADGLGFDYALAAGYDVREMDDVFVLLQRRESQWGGPAVPDFLRTHPAPEERLARVRARVASLDLPAGLRTGREAYLERIDGLVYGPDPRTGFFHGTTFYHLAHRYALRLPAGWIAQNLGRVMIATAPDRSALIYIGAVETSARDAARNLLALPGVDGHGVRSDPINGVRARVVTFEVETTAGARHGMAAFLEHEGRTLEVLGIAAGSGFGSRGVDIVSAITSFEPLRDARFDDVQPLRVRIERLPESMTVAGLANRYPNAVSIDELVILNQAAEAGTRLDAGGLVKRVAGGR